ncbi:MAG: DNA adenine methylase [bacterium]|nr:DNA adenine methylase [bacterium]
MELESQIHYLLQTHAELLLAAQNKDEQVSYVTNYIGSKQKLVDWIWAHTPQGVQSVLDAFSGSAVVGYMYKRKGLRVVANDRLKYAYHIARAIVENNDTTLSDGDIDKLLTDNTNTGSFVQDNFKGLFFAKGVHALIDQIRANIDDLRGYKKDIALFALAKACLNGKGGYCHFQSSVRYEKYEDTLAEFTQRFRNNCNWINGLVYDNGKENRAENSPIDELLPGVKVDLAYFDPPYATEFSTTNYESFYHFIEGLMTYWKGLTIIVDSATHKYAEIEEETITRANSETFFETFLKGAQGISCWIISYRDHAFPNEASIKSMISNSGKVSRMYSKDHAYTMSAHHRQDEASLAKERIFVCGPTETAIRSQADWEEEAKQISQLQPVTAESFASTNKLQCSAITADIKLVSEAKEGISSNTEPEFVFVLTHVGTNLNGDNFTRDELIKAAPSAISRKVDLKHSQDLTDIVGGITESQWKDEEGGLVECTGRLFVADNPHAQLAYRLMKEGIVKQVSMECQYDAGECSICGKKFSSKADYCIHLRKYKGATYQGKPVYEILRGVVFTGVGLLSDKGADERAVIRSVAKTGVKMKTQALTFNEYFLQQQRSMTLWDIVGGLQSYLNDLLGKVKNEDLTNDQAFELMQSGVEQFRSSLEELFQNPADLPTVEAKKMSDHPTPETPPASEAAPASEQIKTLTQENADLKKQVDELSKQLDTLKKAAAQEKAKAKATELVKRFELKGRTFANDAEREAEIERLSALSEEALMAVEITVSGMPDLSTQANRQPIPVLKTDAGVKPINVADTPPGDELKTGLKDGLMAAYKQNRGEAVTN